MLEQALRDAKMVETCIVKEKQDYKQKLKTFKIEINKLKGKEVINVSVLSWEYIPSFSLPNLIYDQE